MATSFEDWGVVGLAAVSCGLLLGASEAASIYLDGETAVWDGAKSKSGQCRSSVELWTLDWLLFLGIWRAAHGHKPMTAPQWQGQPSSIGVSSSCSKRVMASAPASDGIPSAGSAQPSCGGWGWRFQVHALWGLAVQKSGGDVLPAAHSMGLRPRQRYALSSQRRPIMFVSCPQGFHPRALPPLSHQRDRVGARGREAQSGAHPK